MLYHLFEIALIIVAIWVIPQIIFWVGGSLFIVLAIIYAFIGLGLQEWWGMIKMAIEGLSELKADCNKTIAETYQQTKEC